MTTEWDERVVAYQTSETHRTGDDLDLLIELCEGGSGVVALDVAAGGGHVARRLRDLGCDVTTLDRSSAMGPDVVAPAERIPLEDETFDIVASRIAAHHFEDVAGAVAEMGRVTRDRIVIQDMLFRGEQVEEAEKLRDRTHVRSYSQDEWTSFVEAAGLEVDRVELIEKPLPLDDWLARTGCAGADADRVRSLLAHLTQGDAWTSTMIMIRGRKQ